MLRAARRVLGTDQPAGNRRPPDQCDVLAASLTVTFTDNADDETGYYVRRTTDGGQNWLQVGALNPAVPGVGGTGTFLGYSVVGSGVCYRILETNKYGQR